MQLKNNLIIGILIGLLFPVVAYLISEVFLHQEIIKNKPGVPYLVAIACNLVLIRFVFKSNFDKAASGILLSTFLVALLIFIFKINLHHS